MAPPQTVGTIPILPFPFHDIILQGQTKQLNLYEERFHLLFDDVMQNHHSIVGMGLLAGNGMVTTMPLCQVESFTRLGNDEDWISSNDGMGNGSIFVTIRVVGRAKIKGELVQEEPYMKARVVEICDDSLSTLTGAGGVKEKTANKVEGEVDPLEVASLIAGNIETEILSIASMEHRWKEWKEEMKKKRKEKIGDYDWGDGIDRVEVAKLVSRA
jgi:Lon protease-like protein